MSDIQASVLVDEIAVALDNVGEIEDWVERRMDGSVDGAVLESAFVEVTRRLLGDEHPSTAGWEHLIVAAANSSARRNCHVSCEACKRSVEALNRMVQEDCLGIAVQKSVVTIGTALAVVLTAQRKLRQPVEGAVRSLCEKHAECSQEMAERCQDIWQRYGQMSGEDGLFVWDTRNDEWRLALDFKPYRPSS